MTNPFALAGVFLAFTPFGRRMTSVPASEPAPKPAAARAAASSTEAKARELRFRLDELEGSLEEQRQALILKTVGLAGTAAELGTYAPGSPQAAAASDAANRPWKEHAVAAAHDELEAAVLAEELNRYKETGVLTPTPPETAANLKRLLEHSWTLPPSAPEVGGLSLDLTALQTQLKLKPLPRAALRKPARAAPPAARASPPLRLRPEPLAASPAPPALFERDAGTGKPENDPVPDLIVLLSSSNPRGRALAADQLGSLGALAAPAAAALKGALRDADRRVRASAALALGAAGSAGATPELRGALRDPDEEVRLNARSALRMLGFESKYP